MTSWGPRNGFDLLLIVKCWPIRGRRILHDRVIIKFWEREACWVASGNVRSSATGTGWTSLETSVFPARETRERRERRSRRQQTSLSSPHSGSGAHYEIRSCSLGLSLLSLHEPLSHYTLALPRTYPPSVGDCVNTVWLLKSSRNLCHTRHR